MRQPAFRPEHDESVRLVRTFNTVGTIVGWLCLAMLVLIVLVQLYLMGVRIGESHVKAVTTVQHVVLLRPPPYDTFRKLCTHHEGISFIVWFPYAGDYEAACGDSTSYTQEGLLINTKPPVRQ